MPDELISRDEVLGGLPAGRASALLFLIESRTAHMVARTRALPGPGVTDELARERDLAFLEAFTLGREPPLRPRIQDLERHAPTWALFVPADPRVRAAVGHLLGRKYRFTHEAAPGIRAALGLDETATQQAYHRLYRQPLSAIFVPRVTWVDRLRWVSSSVAGSVESLPPFWLALVLTITLSLSQTFLALPIAVADVGPLPAIALVILLGAINILTIVCMAEALARNGAFRYGGAFIGRVASDFLGSAGSGFLTLATSVRIFLTLLATYIGLAATLASLTRVPAQVWAAALFVLGLCVLARKSVSFSLSLMVVLAAINVSLLIVLALLALTQLTTPNLLYINLPVLEPERFDLSRLHQVFGVILMAYIGSSYVAQCAKVVLPRDPGGRSLIWGSVTGTAAIACLFCVWTLAVNGAVRPQLLRGLRGTVVPALAAEVGPSAHVVGSILVMLLLGLAWIRQSNLLFALVRERLPLQSRPIVMLPRARGRLVFQSRADMGRQLRLALTYLGLTGGRARFRVEAQSDGITQSVEMVIAGRWDAGEHIDRLPDLRRRGFLLTLDVLEAAPESTRLRVTSSLIPTYEGEWDTTGLRIVDLLVLPDSTRQLVTWMMRRGDVSVAEVAAETHLDADAARALLETLVDEGFAEKAAAAGAARYRALLARKRGRELPLGIWRALGEKAERGGARHDSRPIGVRPAARRVVELLNDRRRFALAVSPEAMIFLLAEWLFSVGAESFTGVTAVAGVIGNSLVAGLFPVLLLVSSRRKGDVVPDAAFGFLGRPAVATGLYVFFLANLLVHGLVIWQRPLERVTALAVGALVVGATTAMVHRGALTERMVIEIREDLRAGEAALFAVTVAGRPVSAHVTLKYPEGEQHRESASGEVAAFTSLRSVTFRLPPTRAAELKVWVHRVTPDGSSVGLPAALEVQDGRNPRRFDLISSRGQVLLPVSGDTCWCRIIPGGNA